jgi:hypothetical protein
MVLANLAKGICLSGKLQVSVVWAEMHVKLETVILPSKQMQILPVTC